MKTADVVERAAAMIARFGKATGCAEDRLGQLCAVNAIRFAAANDCWSAVVAVVEPLLASSYSSRNAAEDRPLAQWSDANTKDEVVAGLRSAAAILRAQESNPERAKADAPSPITTQTRGKESVTAGETA